jgi:eukaryotic-like serine/threonine-protein kinase
MEEKTQHLYGFGPFRLDPKECLLILDGTPVPLPPKAFEALLFLVENAGHLVDKDDLMRRLWPDTFVEDGNVAKHVSLLRKILSEATNGREYIETIPKRGYRFVAEISDLADQGAGHQSRTVSGASLIGRKISHYRVLQILGGGGMGVVYKAEDLKLGRPVALKFLPEELATDAIALGRFEREARAASALDHPNICTVHEFGEHDGQPFIAMQFLEGQTLRERLAASANSPPSKEGNGTNRLVRVPAFTAEDVLDAALQIAAGLEAAHQKNIIHRDIKPANIFITNRGEVKILDFGLAKAVVVESANAATERDRVDGPRETVAHPVDLTLTGTTMGTASYMSPEQVRGERLDPRTDLFSFGLVLYEMSTGRRAFVGETVPEVHNAILQRTIPPARQLNPEISPELDRIIAKAVEKDRDSRYQHAIDISADLKRLRRERPSRRTRWLIAVATALSVLLVIFTAFWFTRRQPSSPREAKFRQLTSSSSEDPIRYGAISPDGKYLAFADLKGIHVMLVKTGESQTFPQPEVFKASRVDWQFFRWFPDGTRFLVNQNPPEERDAGYSATIWSVSVVGGPPRKLQADAGVESISPDGSLVAFTTDMQNVWLMGPNGEQVRKIYTSAPNKENWNFRFSPNGQRLLDTQYPDGTLESRDLHGRDPVTILSGMLGYRLRDYIWLPDGRVVYSLAEPSPHVGTCNLWSIPVDARNGEPEGKPQRLTNWAGTCAENLSATADGKAIAFQQWTTHASVYVADVEGDGTHIKTPIRLTINDRWNVPTAWTRDSSFVIFKSTFNGETGIYEQRLGQDTPGPIVTGVGDIFDHTPLSPDGSWILYDAPGSPGTDEQLMRSPVGGGLPQVVMTGENYGARCTPSPSVLCVIAERRLGTSFVFSRFVPLKGRGSEIAKINLDPESDFFWDLSPDGRRIAVLEGLSGRIHILSLTGEAVRVINTNGMETTQFINWTADGKALFVSRPTRQGFELLRLDLNGDIHVLWEETGGLGTSALPSPDGKHLAIRGWSVTSNFWTMTNF